MIVCSRLTAIHADTGDAWAASIRPGMGQFVASMRHEMDVPEQVEAYLASQPGPKQADLRRLHAHILADFPGCRLWFTEGTSADGKVVANPNIGYGAYTIPAVSVRSKSFATWPTDRSPRWHSSTISALNSGVNERRRRGFFPMLSMVGHPSGGEPLMMDVRQSGSGPSCRVCACQEPMEFAR